MERGWPKREERKIPTDTFGIIKDELRIDHNEDLFRESLAGLERYYGKTPLAKSLHERTNQIACLINIEDEASHRDISKLVTYSGAIFGLHAAVHHLPHTKKVYVAAQLLPELIWPYEGEPSEDFGKRYAQAHIEDIDDTLEEYMSLPAKHKGLLQRSAQFACAQYGERFEPLFICGTMTSIHYAAPLGDDYAPPSFAL